MQYFNDPKHDDRIRIAIDKMPMHLRNVKKYRRMANLSEEYIFDKDIYDISDITMFK